MKKRKIRWDRVALLIYIAFVFTVLVCTLVSLLLTKPEPVQYSTYALDRATEKLKPVQLDLPEIVEPEPEPEPTVLGEFLISHYCACTKCCGPNAQGITASGAHVQPNHTIAVDTRVIPFGTHVLINGIEYVAEDTGSAIKGNRIDIYVEDHDEANELGIYYTDVILLEK